MNKYFIRIGEEILDRWGSDYIAFSTKSIQELLNTYEFKMGIPNMRIAAGAKSSVNMSFPDLFSEYKAKDLFMASPPVDDYEGIFGIYSKIYAPNRGRSQETRGMTRIAPFRIKNL